MADGVYDLISEKERFLEAVSLGTPPVLAGIEVGWPPGRTKRELADKEFASLVLEARGLMLDSLEVKLYQMALNGNMTAMQMMLYNKRPEDWKDIKRIEVKTETTINVTEVAAAKQALVELIRSGGTKALQPGGALDGDIEEGDVVE